MVCSVPSLLRVDVHIVCGMLFCSLREQQRQEAFILKQSRLVKEESAAEAKKRAKPGKGDKNKKKKEDAGEDGGG